MREQEDNRRPEEIENDIERTRAEVSSTIDAIQSRLTPGQMMDQAFAYARTSLPADFGANLGNTIRDNPVPVALIGVGIGWLMMQGQNSDGRARARRQAAAYERELYASGGFSDTDSGESVGGKMRNMASRAGEKGRELKDQASETGHNLMDKASEIGQRISGSASSVADRARGMTQQTRERVSGAADSAREFGHRSQQQYYQAKDSISQMMDEQPLIVGALWLAIGTLVGALLPGTRREDELMGGPRDRLLDSAKETAREKAGTFKESAQRVAQTAEREVKSAVNDVTAGRGQGNGNAQTANTGTAESVKPDQQSLH